MFLRAETVNGVTTAHAVPIRCPYCRKEGMFHSPRNDFKDVAWSQTMTIGGTTTSYSGFQAGVRVCPNQDCRGFVFLADGPAGKVAFPPETIDFDSTALPATILSSLEEAVLCHAAGAYRATALMVRRVLEELCADRAATGKDLKARLTNLGSNVIVPLDLLDAADELRLLGNDAAHIEAKTYDEIGKSESELAVELAKELLKAVYQYQSLVDRLRGLRKQ
jgi:hypothetical protein